MHDEPLWLEPDYFEDFRCKCGECRSCCCDGWDIAVSRDEYFRLIGMNCSDELHRRLECAFKLPEEPSPERYRLISSNWLGECPMRDGDGLCMLQKECGEDVLPEICRVYPRSLKREGEMLQACCSNGCEAVVEQLMAMPRLRFRFARLEARPELMERASVQELMLGRLCMEALQDRSLSLRQRIGEVCRLVSGKGAEIVPQQQGLEAFHVLLPVLDSISMERFRQEILPVCSDAEEYARQAGLFEARFPDWERWMENILINHMAYMCFPRVDARVDIVGALKGLCAAWALLRCACIAHGAKGSDADFVDAAAAVFRLVEHSSFYYNSSILIERESDLLVL